MKTRLKMFRGGALLNALIMLAALAFFSCGRAGDHSAGSQLNAAPSSTPPPQSKSIALAAGAGGGGGLDNLDGGSGGGREVAHPQILQFLWDHTQQAISPWGPVLYTVSVPTPQGNISANRLSSPDPFTATWQLNDGTGTILVTNLDITQGLGQVEADVEPPTIPWIGPGGYALEIYQNEIVVWYKDTVTEAQVWNEMSLKSLHVKMSWWEPKDDESPGNEIAYFHFQYDPEIFPTFTAAYNYFSTSPLVDLARPAIKGEWESHYTETTSPNDTYYQKNQTRYVNLLGVDTSNNISIGPPYGSWLSNVDFAVIDDGVQRWHTDFIFWHNGTRYSKVSWLGVNCLNSSYVVKLGGGEPASTNDTHGTGVAGIISAITSNTPSNTKGIASLSPRSCILPLRLKFTQGSFDEESLIKAVRALRFEFSHYQWVDDIRVVNMSLGGKRFPYWWLPSKDLKTNIRRDLKLNDRLYVASAGNRGQNIVPSLVYPAAFDCVLGVSGLITNSAGSQWWANYLDYKGNLQGSNYYPDAHSTYPVSGIYWFQEYIDSHYLWADSCYLSLSKTAGGATEEFQAFGGASGAAPQISGLARMLYHLHPGRNYSQVRSRIVSTRDDTKARNSIAGLVDYQEAMSGW